MLLAFIPCKLNCERIFVDPTAVQTVQEEVLTIGPVERKVARIVMESGEKHLVLDDERTAADRINEARLLMMDPDSFEEEEDA